LGLLAFSVAAPVRPMPPSARRRANGPEIPSCDRLFWLRLGRVGPGVVGRVRGDKELRIFFRSFLCPALVSD